MKEEKQRSRRHNIYSPISRSKVSPKTSSPNFKYHLLPPTLLYVYTCMCVFAWFGFVYLHHFSLKFESLLQIIMTQIGNFVNVC